MEIRELDKDLEGNDVLVREILIDFERIADEMKLKQYERVMDVVVQNEIWTSPELVTGALKLKRKNLIEKYGQSIEKSIKTLETTGKLA